MASVLLVVHVLVTLALIGVVLIQKSEGGGLGVGSGGSGFMTGRGTANFLTRTTGILAAVFMGLSLALALINQGTRQPRSLLESPPPAAPTAPAPTLPSLPAVPTN